jgi:hypothetical protein
VVGGPGIDHISTRAGNDTIDVADGRRDVVRCGAGKDTVKADTLDLLTGCERVQRLTIKPKHH